MLAFWNQIILFLFFACYFYQFYYIAVSIWTSRRRRRPALSVAAPLHRFAVLIAARNEENVIGALLDSLHAQDYPADHVDIYVCADNCTDATSIVAAAHGAKVLIRNDHDNIGKGYVLNYMLAHIHKGSKRYDGYLVFDADNILAPNFITEINKTYASGYEAVTCYRNSKNYGDNWISAGYALWFLREAKYLNAARMALGVSCGVSGTGFLFSEKLLEQLGGWHFFTLTEDIEFTAACVSSGVKIGYCGTAELYDEQPTSFATSFRQRLRWSRGYLQVLARYGTALVRCAVKNIFTSVGFSAFDMLMNILPAAVLTGGSLVGGIVSSISAVINGGSVAACVLSVCSAFGGFCCTILVLGMITTITEWQHIHCAVPKKIIYSITFPIFMLTYIPICITSLFVCPSWKPIRHTRCLELQDVKCNGMSRKEHSA